MTILKVAHHPCRPLPDGPSSSAREIAAMAMKYHFTPYAYSVLYIIHKFTGEYPGI